MVTIQLTLQDLMVLRNAVKTGTIERGISEATTNKLSGLGLIELRRDVTDQKQLAEAVRKNRIQLKGIGKTDPASRKALSLLGDLVRNCGYRIDFCTRTGFFVTAKGLEYANAPIEIRMPGTKERTRPKVSNKKESSAPVQQAREGY